MVKFRREIELFYLFIAVCDVLYSKNGVVVEDADKQTDNAKELVHEEEELDK